MKRTRLFLIDRNRALVEATCTLFAESTCVQIIGAAATPEEALRSIVSLSPDMVLVDLIQADQTTFGLIRAIKRLQGAPRVIVMSLYDAAPYQQAACAAGADGFVSKTELVNQLEPLVASLRPLRATGALHSFTTTSPIRIA